MQKISRSVVAALMLGALVAGLSGCQKKEGPAEHAGKAIDNAVDKTEHQVGKTMEKTGEKMEEAGEKMKNAAHK